MTNTRTMQGWYVFSPAFVLWQNPKHHI